MPRLLFSVALLFWAASLPAQSLPPAVTQALAAARIPEQAVAVTVLALDAPADAPPLISHNAQAAMNPASVMKLVTTYAALEILGPATTWKTGIWADVTPDPDGRLRGNLYLKGSGDPKLTMEHLWTLLRQLRARGVQHIEGNLILDRSVFNVPPYNPAAFDNRPMRAYNVGPDGLLMDFRALRFTLRPEDDAIKVWLETPSENLWVDARLTPGKGGCNGWRDQLAIRYTPARDHPGQLSISGAYPVSCGETTLALAPLPADRHVEGLFRALWKEQGGALRGQVKAGVLSPGAKLLVSQESPPVAEIIRDVNKWSNNVMARQLFLSLGNRNNGDKNDKGGATEEKARLRVQDWLRRKGLEFPELVLENGSGLSRQERISAAHLARLLHAAWQSEAMPELLASLPIAGQDGTMKKRLNHTAAENRARIKTGTLDGVKTAAGYIQDIRGRRYAVTFFINHPNAAAGQNAMDALMLWVAQGIGNSNRP
ncbi:MAG: D-alanyl-D-alanine carboxypeptidase/D-alanyl-D-alanine-endopeptidase [Zoogloeaceae bacterium]|jgi:D-alanyl-D-alanine carboxypeptidase/D-alanyl-D-alanine-endopeptidase (penicillin-binding protein 4)|nr:D-alanyl-D-alanine carboxypeptidase/D-alanyl-D-alanine-endopeptidase [Zoogloeaceae bacterium]